MEAPSNRLLINIIMIIIVIIIIIIIIIIITIIIIVCLWRSKDILTEAINHLAQPIVRSVVASNQYASPVLTYLMWAQTWPIANIQRLDREGRKIIVEKMEEITLRDRQRYRLDMSRKLGGRGLKSVENE